MNTSKSCIRPLTYPHSCPAHRELRDSAQAAMHAAIIALRAKDLAIAVVEAALRVVGGLVINGARRVE